MVRRRVHGYSTLLFLLARPCVFRIASLAMIVMTCSGCFPVFMVGAMVSGPFMSQTPNSACYLLDKEGRQHRPCKPEETR